MCGITGVYAFNEIGRMSSIHLSNAVQAMKKRGPDWQDMSLHGLCNLGHVRLAIIDLNRESNQPFTEETGRYTIVFNGEIYNYKDIRKDLETKGFTFNTQSDTEVLLKAYICYKTDVFKYLNGFFAFAIYDTETGEMILARDRLGIKPLYIYEDEDKILFSSEMKSLLAYKIPKELDEISMFQYFQLNYIPAPRSIFKNVRKLMPAHYLILNKRQKTEVKYDEIPHFSPENTPKGNYDDWQKGFYDTLDQAVQRRLVADVPLGAFLSGGIDSSVVVALASKHVKKLHTFSIGYAENKFFDETQYAQAVAKKFNTEHTVFSLKNSDLYGDLMPVLDYIDEPFADSSALAVHILSRYTRKHATVALSGDGADEMLSGYNKHSAEYRARQGGFLPNMVKNLGFLWNMLPQSRNGFFSNKVRQLKRFAEGLSLSPAERYWRWATFAQENEVKKMLSPAFLQKINQEIYKQDKTEILKALTSEKVADFHQFLHTDMTLVLPNDMLVKVDLMSMANALEVRCPFLDMEVVRYATSLPTSAKIDSKLRKKILQDTFRNVLPAELYNRPKRGFEIPLLQWLRTDLRSLIENDLLEDNFVREQGIFDVGEIQNMKKQLFSNNPQDIHARIWALVVFQYWWKKYFV